MICIFRIFLHVLHDRLLIIYWCGCYKIFVINEATKWHNGTIERSYSEWIVCSIEFCMECSMWLIAVVSLFFYEISYGQRAIWKQSAQVENCKFYSVRWLVDQQLGSIGRFKLHNISNNIGRITWWLNGDLMVGNSFFNCIRSCIWI